MPDSGRRTLRKLLKRAHKMGQYHRDEHPQNGHFPAERHASVTDPENRARTVTYEGHKKDTECARTAGWTEGLASGQTLREELLASSRESLLGIKKSCLLRSANPMWPSPGRALRKSYGRTKRVRIIAMSVLQTAIFWPSVTEPKNSFPAVAFEGQKRDTRCGRKEG